MEQQAMADKHVPWDGWLPPEIVSLIASKYTSDAAEYVSLRGVCHHWYNSLTKASPKPRLPSPQLPFLLVPQVKPMPRLGKVFCVPFLNPDHVRPLIDDLPQLKNTEGSICVGSSHGWLITLDQDSTVSLLNPVTADKIYLNILSSIDDASLSFNRDSYPEYHLKETGLGHTQFSIVHRAVLSSDPAEDCNFTLMMFLSGLTDRCFTLCGKHRKWSLHKHQALLVEDVIFINGVFIAIDDSVNLVFFDFRSHKSEPVITRYRVFLSAPPTNRFLVNSDGRLLIIVSSNNQTFTPRAYINVLEHPFNGEPRIEDWNIKEFNNLVLFLGYGCSVSVPVRHFTSLGNKVYSTQVNLDELEIGAESMTILYEGGVYQNYVGDRRTEPGRVFHVESSHYADHWVAPRPFWVTPNINRFSEKSLCISFDESVNVF